VVNGELDLLRTFSAAGLSNPAARPQSVVVPPPNTN